LEGIATPTLGRGRGGGNGLKSLTWFGRDCDTLGKRRSQSIGQAIEVVDLVWKGLRHEVFYCIHNFLLIEVVDLVWKGLRHRHRRNPPGRSDRIEVVDLVWKGLRHVISLRAPMALANY